MKRRAACMMYVGGGSMCGKVNTCLFVHCIHKVQDVINRGRTE